ncbi:4-hydroxyphenylpyruvate dioxygenase family protein [Bradymonas sediminis]|uniref:4-hydroxyphenylpyruvate dioxygenase n=1 Tax=Bradymonas sediminis TaxID=1548548 RepID=A0A2Z4FGD8_9DELT|nr:VOC family protein [Bradymonas sediminis]AWV87918.1 4-hydroxyphenylpyruvate dioxygenase [Bradymonas sediminis]TDP62936.1 4-hydroxyphenylpyruvate dioxygenase [Bradymonas sediminis]
MTDITNLGILGYDGLRFVTLDLKRSHDFYTKKVGFTQIAKSSDAWTEETGDTAAVYQAGDVTIEVIEPNRDGSFGSYHRHFHAAGIATVNFRVRDIEAAWKHLEERGATFIADIQTDEIDGGRYRRFEIATPLGNATFGFVERAEYPGYAPGFDVVETDVHNEFGIGGIDHLTVNMSTLKPYIDWYKNVLGMEKFWEIDFHTSDINPGAGSGSGLKSIVAKDPESGVKFANNEPLRPYFHRSQIQKYLEDFGGPGIQHAAFEVEDIITVVREMRERGVVFLHTPHSYYAARPATLAEQGVPEIDEDWQVLEDLEIAIDGSEDGYLLQIFMKEAALLYDEPEAGPFFIELIQRKGDRGFGGGNFRALFEAIERDQLGDLAGTKAE